jgi:hypothetical protein
MYGPPLAIELQRQRPLRNPAFVCSFNDLLELIRLGQAWSVPELVAGWKESAGDHPLGHHLARIGKVYRPQSPFESRVGTWTAALPVLGKDPDSAAA